MTPAEHFRQNDRVRLSLLLPESRADRRDRPLKRTVAVVTQREKPSAGAHVYVIPVVTERLL